MCPVCNSFVTAVYMVYQFNSSKFFILIKYIHTLHFFDNLSAILFFILYIILCSLEHIDILVLFIDVKKNQNEIALSDAFNSFSCICLSLVLRKKEVWIILGYREKKVYVLPKRNSLNAHDHKVFVLNVCFRLLNNTNTCCWTKLLYPLLPPNKQ